MSQELGVDPSFERINADKRERIIQAAMQEFASQGFTSASTNNIVKQAGISKGSLFKYFGSKDALYLYTAEYVLRQVIPMIREKLVEMPDDILIRLQRLSESVVDIYIDNPLYYRFFMGILDAGAFHLQQTLLRRNEEMVSFLDLFSGVNTSRFRFSDETTFLLIKWLFTGLKQEVFENEDVLEDPTKLREQFSSRIGDVIEALKSGIYR